jgi:hypothetical protein
VSTVLRQALSRNQYPPAAARQPLKESPATRKLDPVSAAKSACLSQQKPPTGAQLFITCQPIA